MNETEGNGDGGYGQTYVTAGECTGKSSAIILSIRENRNALYGVPGGDGGMMTSLTELWSEWNTFKGFVKFLMGSSLLLLVLNILTLLRMFNIV